MVALGPVPTEQSEKAQSTLLAKLGLECSSPDPQTPRPLGSIGPSAVASTPTPIAWRKQM